MSNHEQELARLLARIHNLEEVCAEAYQLAGAVGAPVRILDMLWAAADGKMVNVEGIRPVLADECEEIQTLRRQLEEVQHIITTGPATAELGRIKSSRTSAAKRRTARANGRKGGRPRKAA